jgi:hypothetical protein
VKRDIRWRKRSPLLGLDESLLAQRNEIRAVLGRQWWQALLLSAGRLAFDYLCLLFLLGTAGGWADRLRRLPDPVPRPPVTRTHQRGTGVIKPTWPRPGNLPGPLPARQWAVRWPSPVTNSCTTDADGFLQNGRAAPKADMRGVSRRSGGVRSRALRLGREQAQPERSRQMFRRELSRVAGVTGRLRSG